MQKGIRPFVVIPLLVNIGVFSLGIWLAKSQFEILMTSLLGWLPSWLSWVEYLLWPIFAILILIAIFYTFTIIANLIASPFNSLLAERVEQKLNGQPVAEFKGIKENLKNASKAVGSEVSKAMYSLKWLPVLLIITVIPGVNFIAPFAWGIYGAWMLSLQYTDFAMGNHQLFVKDELPILRKNRSAALGFGGILTLLMMIPVVNFFVMPVGVAGGAAFWVKSLSNNR
ncbi:UNVERIFIED_CONTAM: hypothetical protein GTU68_001045 [Idotea baltica]|nr:hypothetical protein [Idotea baltica]